MIGIISTLIFGLVAGAVAKLLMPGRDPGGWFMTALLGVVGAFVGKLISALFGGTGDITRWTWHGFFLSVLGAMILLFLYNRFVARRHRRVTHQR